MSWKSFEEKKHFFEQLDKAFNTPPTETLVVPKFNEGKRRASKPTGTSNTKKRRTSSSNRMSKTRKTSGSKPEEQKKSNLLDGMVLFFIPNSRKNGVRRFRMTLFPQHGAAVRDVWRMILHMSSVM
jgi:hypothetical protein